MVGNDGSGGEKQALLIATGKSKGNGMRHYGTAASKFRGVKDEFIEVRPAGVRRSRKIWWLTACGLALSFGLLWHQYSLMAMMLKVSGFAESTDPVNLVPFVFRPLPLGSIKPRGWLLSQLQLMANGLAGHQHEFYRFVSNSSWLGGSSEYSNLNEGFPYWLNGIVPLAYSLDDPRLKHQIKKNVQYVIENQQEDGWLGPEMKDSGYRNLWARYPLLIGLTQLLEADASYRDSLLPAIRKFAQLTYSMLKTNGTGYLQQPGDKLSDQDHGWGRIRVADLILSLQWLYEHDYESSQAKELVETMRMLREGSLDWAQWYTEENYIWEDVNRVNETYVDQWFPYEHGVNVAQGLKMGAVVNRFEHNQTMVAVSRRAVEWTFKYHGSASGSILADERLAGLAPYYGAELCTTVEVMYSLSYLYQALGDKNFADRAELAAFNALPAAVLGDWWSHQYVTQSNQPYSRQLEAPFPFWNVNGRGQTFGLEPDYPCCTINHVQGYPKFLANSWVMVGTDGLGHALLSPSTVKKKLQNGAEVSIDVDTQYPFTDKLSYDIISSASFTLYIRIPAWSKTWSLTTSNKLITLLKSSMDSKTGMYPIPVGPGHTWVILQLTRSITTVPRANNSVAIIHGPLLYTLDVGHNARHTAPRDYRPENGRLQGNIPTEAKDWTIENTKPWNMIIDIKTLRAKSRHDNETEQSLELPDQIWSPGAPPIYLEAIGCEIAWPLFRGVPGEVPANRTCLGDERTVRLWPVGSSKIGMVELPTLP